MPNDADKNEVVISVRGGCFEIDIIPDNLQVVVKDYDCLDTVGPLARKVFRDAYGDRYMRTVHEGGETPQMTERQKKIIRLSLQSTINDLVTGRFVLRDLDGCFSTMTEEELSAIIDLLN